MYITLNLCTLIGYHKECDQIWRFLKKLSATNFLVKVAILETINLCKNYCGYYLVNFWKHLGNI